MNLGFVSQTEPPTLLGEIGGLIGQVAEGASKIITAKERISFERGTLRQQPNGPSDTVPQGSNLGGALTIGLVAVAGILIARSL